MIDGVYALSDFAWILGKVLFFLDAPTRNARSWAYFAANIGAYKMPMTNLLEIF